jgi:hypothetical protein
MSHEAEAASGYNVDPTKGARGDPSSQVSKIEVPEGEASEVVVILM